MAKFLQKKLVVKVTEFTEIILVDCRTAKAVSIVKT